MKFDPQQQSVISHKSGNALILAGAGSGKTATATERAAQLIYDGVPTSSIVMMTFTNKAAREMRQRINARLVAMGIEVKSPPAATTFHSFGQRIITKNIDACGRSGMPSLMSGDDQDSLLASSFKLTCNEFTAKAGAEFYDKIRNHGLSAGFAADEMAIARMLGDLCMAMPVPIKWEPIMAGMIEYEQAKKKMNALDYHDLLILPIHALTVDTNLRDKFRKHIKDLTVDEAQDTNIAQYKLVKLIAPPTGDQTVIMIGDEDQSIHRWRGANPENLRVFNQEYNPTHFRLEHNYRSRPDIVNRADQLIKNNTGRFEKDGIPVRPATHNPIVLVHSKDTDGMSAAIASQIRTDIDNGMDPADMAILYRTNRMANLLEPALLAQGIPYKIYNGQDLLSRQESKILLAAIRFAVNPRDLMAFSRLTELMPGAGAKFVEKLISDMKRGETIFDAALRLPATSQKTVLPMLKSIVQLRNSGPTKLINWVESQSEIRNWLTKKAHAHLKVSKSGKPKEFDSWKKFNRTEALSDEEKKALSDSRVIERCEKYQERLNETISTSIDRMKLVCKTINDRCKLLPADSQIEEQWFEANNLVAAPPDEENRAPSVHLMTIHSSKGLEWSSVYLPGMSDGIMPFNRGGSEDGNIDPDHMQDERRLAYVGITRAQDHLYVHHCDRINLMDGKGNRYVSPSPFIKEAGVFMPTGKVVEDASFAM